MTTTDTDGTSPTNGDRTGSADGTNGAVHGPDAPRAAGTSEPGRSSAAGESSKPARSHDPVTDAVTTEMAALPADVRGPDDPAPHGAGRSGTAAAPADPPVTTEMPKFDAPPSPPARGGDARPVYEVRAAAVGPQGPKEGPKAPDEPPATPPPGRSPASPPPGRADQAADDLPVTEPVPSVVQRPATARGDRRDESTRLQFAGAGATGPEERPRHFRVPAGPAKPITGDIPKVEDKPRSRRPKGSTVAIVAPLIVLMLLIVAWAADTASLSGQVLRNVEVAGRQIGGKGEEALPEIMADLAAEQAERKVTIEIQGDAAAATTPTTAGLRQPASRPGDRTTLRKYETTTAALGLVLDEDATIKAALDTGRGDTVFVQPLKWLKSFFSAREVPLKFTVTETQTAATLQLLQGNDRTVPTDPSIQLTGGGFVVTPGRAGQGISVSEVADDLLEGARSSHEGAITIRAEAAPEQPRFTDDEAQQLADRANGLTADGITLKADTATVPVPAPQLRTWIKPAVVEGKLDLAFNADKANQDLPGLFSGLSGDAEDAKMTLQNGVPTVVPGHNGVTCCGEGATDKIWDAVKQDKGEVALDAVITEPEITTEELQSWGIKEPVGGSRGYQTGQEIQGPGPGFTTYHACCEPRVTNIHKIADIVRGTVIPPDGTFSVNDTVGERTTAKGFVEAGAIRDGVHVPEIGGGVSQFATTTFNAAYFAGLDIEESQSHSEWFSRYPPGREATMGFPHPDLVIHNNTPYGVMIWTSYTDTSLTVTMYSTRYASAEQSGSNESMSGLCRVVVTTRTRTYPDKPTETDTFRSTYRPTGKTCEGQPTTTTTAPGTGGGR